MVRLPPCPGQLDTAASFPLAMHHDLLLEIGVEELPASFVTQAIQSLPSLLVSEFRRLRLEHESVWASGTPRRLAVLVRGLWDAQADLDEHVVGPPTRVAFDSSGKPTRAALSFASKLGCAVEELERTATPKGEYLSGRRVEKGLPTAGLLPDALVRICSEIPFRKSMRWADVETAFGRPVRWLAAIYGDEPLDFEFAGVLSGPFSHGHRFLAPDAFALGDPDEYQPALRERHVIVDIAERRSLMLERLNAAAESAHGTLIQDDFLVEENCSLVEDPQVIVGSFDESFLALPEQVILNVMRGHQRYFGLRSPDAKLQPKYLAVAGTALQPENIRRGNDRVMRARLADAKFFYEEDLKKPLGDRRPLLDTVVFHKRLGSVGDKVRRLERLIALLGSALGIPSDEVEQAQAGIGLAKCDLVTLMVGELPELQGDMGRAYAESQGVDRAVSAVIAEHYLPRGADDPTAPSGPGALAAIADRLDTLVGCFAIGLIPTGAADPLALRRAAIGLLRTILDRGWDLSIDDAVRCAHGQFGQGLLDRSPEDTSRELGNFLRQRLRGILDEPTDVIEACLGAAGDRPWDVSLRCQALGAIDESVRNGAAEVFKRAANIAKEAPEGDAQAPGEVTPDVHQSEQKVFDVFSALKKTLGMAHTRRDYAGALGAIAAFAPVLAQFFEDVFVMVDDLKVRHNRLRLMREIHRTCSTVAHFDLLSGRRAA